MMHAAPVGMMPDLAQPAGLTDQERMANLIRQCMAPLPSVRLPSTLMSCRIHHVYRGMSCLAFDSQMEFCHEHLAACLADASKGAVFGTGGSASAAGSSFLSGFCSLCSLHATLMLCQY